VHPKYHYSVATLYQEKGDKKNAIKHLKRFLEIWNNADENNPELIDARKRLKVLDPYFINMNLTGKHQKKDASINHSAMFGSYDSYPMITAANSYYLKGRLDQAIELYEAAVEMNPHFSGQIYIACVTALQPDFDQAIEWVNAYIPLSSAGLTEPGGRGWRGFFYCLTGQYNKAFIDLNFAINKFKQWESCYYQALCEVVMGFLFYEKQDYKKSKMYFNNYMKILTEKNIATTLDFINFSCEPFLGLIDIRQGNMVSARKRLEKKDSVLSGLHLNVKDLTKFHYQMMEAEFLLAQDSIDAAIAIAENIKELAPPLYHFNSERFLFYNSPFSKDILARAYLKKGNIDKAIAEYERLTHFNPTSKDRRLMYPKYHYYVARLYQEKDEKESAVKHLDQFLEIWKNADDDIPELIDAKKRLKELTNQ
jgi:tetratricopeptide (TPR) repeat protein